MDLDCMICMGPHASKDCNQRKLQHCSDCHIYIRHCSDHTSVCSKKSWIYDVYDELYARMPLQRCNIGFNQEVRFFMNDIWRKSYEGIEAYSANNGIYFHFATDRDLTVQSNRFVHGRILIIVKDMDGAFKQKLVLMTSKTKMILATVMDQPFNLSNAKQFTGDTSLILAVSGDCDPVITISLFPKNGRARHHDLCFDSAMKAFQIPDELKIVTAGSTPTDAQQPCTTIAICQAVSTHSYRNAIDEQHKDNRCFECHVPATGVDDHAQQCATKWFVSQYQDMYVKIPTVRCVLRFHKMPKILMDGKFVKIERDGLFFSPMSDTLFKTKVTGQVELLTTGFTRVRIPIIIEDDGIFKEKLILISSHDRTIICAKGSRHVDPAKEPHAFKYNTPLMLCIKGDAGAALKIEVHSRGSNINRYEVPYRKGSFEIPHHLDVSSKVFNLNMFDADLPQKKQKRQY